MNCFAIKRSNPFRGVLQIIESTSGRALSTNGESWQLQLKIREGMTVRISDKIDPHKSYYRYGVLLENRELVRFPLAPHLNAQAFKKQCEDLIQNIQSQTTHLPFPLLDFYELWLLDKNQQRPLALLDSCCEKPNIRNKTHPHWEAKLSDYKSYQNPPLRSQVENLVQSLAGPNPAMEWFLRDNEGNGQSISNQQNFKRSYFPAFLIRHDWQNYCYRDQSDKSIKPVPFVTEKAIIEDFIKWTSPALLTLQNLDTQQRLFLESHIRIQAAAVNQHHHLYPQCIEPKLINSALVQSTLQRANSHMDSTKTA